MPRSLSHAGLAAILFVSSSSPSLASYHQETPPLRMPGMRFERKVTGDNFDLVALLPEVLPKAGEELKVTFQIRSKTAPHTRLTLAFFVDGQEISSLKGVVPPYQTASADFTWRAKAGRHRLGAKLSSALKVVIETWEAKIEIPPKG